MEEFKKSDNNIQYYCSICNTSPEQLSNHNEHLKTQKHIYKKKCFEYCVNMTVFHCHNYKNDVSRSELIRMFENDTNYKFNFGDKESHSKLSKWRINYLINNENILKSEFPKAVIPPANCEIMDKPDFTEKWLKKIIELNETNTIKIQKQNRDDKKTSLLYTIVDVKIGNTHKK
jgi:hypothetical protein